MEIIYTVTAFQRIRHSKVCDYMPDFGERRCMGWFSTKEEAENAVENNINDIYENFYEYAIIEKVDSGIKLPDVERYLYKWENDKYKPIDIPIELNNISNFGIG